MNAEPITTRYVIDVAQRMTAKVVGCGDEPDWARSVASEEVSPGIWLRRMDYLAECELVNRGFGAATVCICVFFDGGGSLAVADGPPLEVVPGTTVVFHAPTPVGGENRIRAGSRVRCVDFRFAPERVRALGMPEFSTVARKCPLDCSVRDTLLIGRPTSPALARVALEAMECRFVGQPRKLFLHAKALEALALVLADGIAAAAEGSGLKPKDIERVRAAADLMTDRYDEPWTIAKLARAVGLNERKVKEGFKAVLGSTFHDYLTGLRLDAAARMLAEGASVTDAAFAVGHNNLSHFAKAFRRRHGVPPSRWRDAPR